MTAPLALPRISPISAGIASLVFGAMAIGTVAAFALAVLLPYIRNGVPPADWTGGKIALALAVIVALFAHLGFTIYQMFRVDFSEHGVSVPSLRGRRVVPWADVRRVNVQGHRVLLDAPGGKVVINLLCFTDAKVVLTYLAHRMAAHVAPATVDAT